MPLLVAPPGSSGSLTKPPSALRTNLREVSKRASLIEHTLFLRVSLCQQYKRKTLLSRAGLLQHADHGGQAACLRLLQGGLAAPVLMVDVGALLEQGAHAFRVPDLGGADEGSPAPAVLCVHLRAGLQQQRNHGLLASGGSADQRRPAIAVGG